MSANIILDDAGDLTLVAGEPGSLNGTTRILVSRKVLSIASPVWKAMLTGHFREKDALELPLPDDDLSALMIVLHIAHLRFNRLPDSMTLSDLLQLAKLCDKYDTVSVLRPFLQKWVDPLEKYYDVSFREEWLFIAWTFGYQTMFGSTLSTVIREVAVCRDSGCLKWEGRNISHSLPPGIQGTLRLLCR